MSGKPIAAAVFVALFAVALTIPFRNSGDKKPSEGATPSATQTESPGEAKPTFVEAPFPRKAHLEGEYPPACFTKAEPGGDGHVAYYVDGGIGVAAADGTGKIVIGDEQPFKWSASGNYLATGSGTVYEPGGAVAGTLFNDDVTHDWAWSPISDCAVVSSQKGIIVFQPNQVPVQITFRPVSRMAFSPTGGALAFIRTGESGLSIWKADLQSGELEEIARPEVADGEEVLLAGWSPDGGDVYYWVGDVSELLSKGEGLRAVSSESKHPLPVVVAHTDFVTHCGDNTIAVTGKGARIEPSPKRLASIKAEVDPVYLTPPDQWDVSPACSPDGSFIASIHADDVEGTSTHHVGLLNLDGTVADLISSGEEYEDAAPMWGQGDAGLMFVRIPAAGGNPEIWRARPGGNPQPTGLTLGKIEADPDKRRDAWGRFIDWSADSPTGLSVTSEPSTP